MRPPRKSILFHLRRRSAAALRRLRWAVTPALCLFLAPQAYAYCGGGIDWLDFPQLKVASDGNHYTGVVGIGYGWEGRVSIECEGFPLVKSWDLYPRLSVEGLDTFSFSLYKAGKSYPFGKWVKNVHRTVGTLFPGGFVNEYATAACNLHLDLLMEQGHPKAQVLGQKQVIAAQVWGDLSIDTTVGTPIIQAYSKNVEITCEKSPVQPPKPPKPGSSDIAMSGELELDNAKLVVFPGSYSGPCPKDLTLFMEVQGNHKGTFEARIESTAGWTSTKTVLQTNEFEESSGLWGREFSEPFTVPVEKPKPSGGGGGGGIPPGPGDLQVLPKPGDDLFPGTSGPKGVGGLTAKDPGPNVHKQSLRLAAKANGKIVYSDWQQYSVTCDPKPAIPPATTAFLPGGSGPKPPNLDDSDPKPGAPEPQAPGPKPSQPAPGPANSGAKKSSARPAPGSSLSEPAAGATAGAAAKPDLRVVRARRSAQSPNTVEFEVENGGRGAAAKSSAQLTCQRAEGGFETWSAPVPAIPASGRQWIKTSPRKAKPVRKAVRGCEIRVDSTNAVPETDERNNGFSCGDCAERSRRER